MANANTTVRPSEDQIPTAVREAFANPTLQAAWRMAASAQSGDRQAGIEGVVRLLAKSNLNLGDILTEILDPRNAAPAKPSMNSAFAGFGDIFAQTMRNAKPAAEKPVAKPRPRIRRDGDIPATIHGEIKVMEEHTIRSGRMLVFEVSNHEMICSPIVCFSNIAIEKLKKAAETGGFMAMSIRQPMGDNQMPSATNVRAL